MSHPVTKFGYMTKRRIDQPGMWQHVFSRSIDEIDLFETGEDRQDFLDIVGDVSRKTGAEVHAFALMSNHFHLVVHFPDGDMAGFMQKVKSRYARRFNWRYGRRGALFAERYGSRWIGATTDLASDLATVIRYVHRNPLDLLRGAPLEAYEWSSLRTYLGLSNRWPWLHTEPLLALFGNSPDRVAGFVEQDW